MAASTALGTVFDVESFVHEYYGAWGGTDEDRIMSFYADNVVLQLPGTLLEGKEALREQFVRPFITAFPGNRHLVKNMTFGPGVVVVEWSFEAQHKGSFAGHAATGARVKVPGCGVYEYDSAKRQITAARIYFDMGTLLQIITDSLIEERTKAEETLQSNQHNLSLITNLIPTFIHVLRGDGSVLYVNQAVLDYTGLTLEDVRKKDYPARCFHPEDVKRLREERREAFTRAVRFENEQRVLGKDGRYRWFLVRYNPLLDEQGRVDRWYVAAFDIEDRKRAEWLRAAEMRTLQMITDGASLTDILNQVCTSIDLQIAPWFTTILLMDPDGKKLWPGAGPRVPQDWARAITPLPVAADTGLCGTAAFLKTRVIVPDVAGESIWREEYRGPALKNAIRAGWSQPIVTKDNQALGTFAVYSAEPRVPTDEDLALIEAAGPIALIAIERQRSQEALDKARSELAHAERVMSLGALTASIAHEINQPIAAAITSAGACLRWLNRDQPEVQRAREAAMRVEEDGKRASEIISHLKSFYKKDVAPRREMVSVNELVSDMQVLLRSEADRHSVVMRTELAADLPVVSADRVQLQQVLMNLMLNAMEAMSDRGGELSIRTRREGREVMVSVGDTGVGIPPDKMEEIFKAFFTTKAGGTGMGLAISSTIIESHGGGLWATVNPGGGATFHFTLSTEPEAHR